MMLIKPRLRRCETLSKKWCNWACHGGGYVGYGREPKDAYSDWRGRYIHQARAVAK